jgi:NAD(P)H-dependent FMN reductase
MYTIAIISSSVRIGRQSHHVALFFKQFIESNQLASVDLLDLMEYQFPIFDERLSKMKDPSPQLLSFSERVKAADGIIIVTPEYNGGYPASLKNAIDLLYPEWKRKPIAIASVSNGSFAGSQVLTSLTFTLTKIGATVVPNMYRVGNVQDVYDKQGHASDPNVQKFARTFVDELLWYIEAMNNKEKS